MMEKEDKLSKCVLIYGGIKFAQKHLPSDDTLTESQKDRMLKLLAEQEKTIERILKMNFIDEKNRDSVSYRIFQLCQKDIYSVV